IKSNQIPKLNLSAVNANESTQTLSPRTLKQLDNTKNSNEHQLEIAKLFSNLSGINDQSKSIVNDLKTSIQGATDALFEDNICTATEIEADVLENQL
ncbi:hypothetical protein, partial [Klebsiella pneumoniae]|uniref:hypothetical protein n=1 Tax=Klebsiella pneumoniae TaxID=573 RepID=UPI0034E9472E